MYPLSVNSTVRTALALGTWNRVRIEAIGSTINTWINGVQCARLVNDMIAEEFIGLQVHSIHDESLIGAEVKWRDVRIMTENLEEQRRTSDPQVREVSYLKNQLTEWEKSHGWGLLWAGKTGEGWCGAKLDHFPENGWTMDDGVLTIQATDGGEATGPGDIVTTELFSDFELELEFKIAESAYSGIKYVVDPDLNQGPGSAIGNEFQILDAQRHPDANMGVAANQTVGSLYDLIAPTNLEYQYRGKPFNGAIEWKKARIVSKDGHVEHWLNNVKVFEYDRFSRMFAALVAYSK